MNKNIRRNGILSVSVVLLVLLVVPSAAAASDWTPIGPAGEYVRDFAVSPEYPDDLEIIFLDNDQQPATVYITHDGGASWTGFNIAGKNGVFNDVGYGSSPDTIHLAGANGAGFISSYDGGVTWVEHSPQVQVPGLGGYLGAHDACFMGDFVAMCGNFWAGISRDGAQTVTTITQNATNGLPSGSFLSIELSPNFEQDNLILVGTNTHEVYRSEDGGATWSWSGAGLPPTSNQAGTGYIEDLLFSPAFTQDHTVFAYSHTHGIYKSTDAGVTWRSAFPGAYNRFGEMAASPNYITDGTIFYSGYVPSQGGYGAYVSRDRGESWTKLDETGLPPEDYPLGPIAPSPAYASDNRVFLGTYADGLYSAQLTPQYPVPVLQDDAYVTDEDQVLTVDAPGVIGNDENMDGASIATVTVPSHGSLTLNADGSFIYSPESDYYGTDSFTYSASSGSGDSNEATVTITINPVNDAPAAENDAYSTDEEIALTVPSPGVLANDADPEGSSLTAAVSTPPGHGTLILNPDGSFTYTPDENYAGTDSFTYTASDGTTDSNEATVTITINPVNDAPAASDDTYTTSEGTPLSVPESGVLANDQDPDGDALTAVPADPAQHGTVALNSDGSFTYTPDPGFSGTDTFTYRASDGTADSNVATVTVTVIAVNHPPAATDDVCTLEQDTTHTEPVPGVLANDNDPDGDGLTAVLETDVSHGNLALSNTGSFTYTPAAGWSGTDTFTYRAFDGDLYSGAATVTITVTEAVNNPPVIASVTVPTDPRPLGSTVSVSGTFTDPDAGDSHTAIWTWDDGTTSEGSVASGTVTGSHVYADEAGIYTVALTVTDSKGAKETYTEEQYVVIYDPNAGFVTGGGWINSPAGAYADDPSLTGKATFGFVAKYHKGAKVPTGQTEFQFKAGDLNFHSSSYDWLVVAGARAQYKGVGTVNGAGDYGFMLSATDAALTPSTNTDRFRIKIWDRASGKMVYDNQMGAGDDAEPATAIGGGSIVIHAKK